MNSTLPFPSQIIDEINRIRLNPKNYARKLLNYTQYIQDNILRLPQYKNGIVTNEGAVAFQEAATYLNTVPKLTSLIFDDTLSAAAETLADEMTYHKDLVSIDKINRKQIIAEYGKFEGDYGQSIDFGSQTPELVVMNLIVDDGDPQRRNRLMLFNDKFTKIGCASCRHPSFRTCTVLLFATKFIRSITEPKGKKNIVHLKHKPKDDEEEDDNDYQQNYYYPEHQMQMKINEGKFNKNNNNELRNYDEHIDEMYLPKGVSKIDKKERIIIEDGKRLKIIKIVTYMENGEINTQLFKTQI
jgi:uncharacterized protein YkwD